MDKQLIATTLNNTLDPNPAVRQPAEKNLEQLEKTPGYLATLLEIITINDIPLQIRQAAILRLKNIVKHYWTIREGKSNRISDADRKIIKDNILEAVIFQQVPLIRVQLLEVCLWLVKGDFPDKWPELLPAVMKNFQSGDEIRVYGALSVLLTIFKKYAYKADDVRSKLVDETFPTLLQLFQTVCNSMTPTAFEVQRILVKIFYLATQMSLPVYVKVPQNASLWFERLLAILNTQLPADQTPNTKEALKEHPLWVAKKWSARIFNRMFQRFGREQYVADETKPWAKMFFEKFAPVVLETFFKVLQTRAQGQPITDWVLQLTYNYVDCVVTHAALYKLMKPHLRFILLESVFPTLCLNQDDLQLWQENPQEFVRKSMDAMEEFHDPKVAATNVLITLVKVRTRDCLEMVLTAITQILGQYQQKQGNLEAAIHKDAALRMMGCLRKLLMNQEKYHGSIEEILINHVFPDFKSNFGFLRARASWIIGQFSKLEYKNKEQYSLSLQMTCNALSDPELPVKLEAAMALSRLVQNDEVPQYIKPQVPLLLEQFFRVIDEVGNEEVVLTLGTLIGQIGEDIAPYAIEITTRLSKMFLVLIKADEEDDESACTALQCLRAINTMLYSLEKLPDTYAPLEQLLQPLIIQMIREDGIEFFDDILEMMTCFLYFGKDVSPFMWSLVPKIVEAFHGWAMDYMPNILPPLDCIISKGVDTVVTCQNPNLMQLILSMPKVLIEDPDKEHDAKSGCKLLETILAHCTDRIDGIVPDILKLVGTKLFVAKDEQLKLLLLDVVSGCAYYNPQLFVNTLAQLGPDFEKNLFKIWMELLPRMEKVHKHQKMSILGLTSLMQVPVASLPNLLRSGLPEVMNQLVGVLQRLKVLNDEEMNEEEEDDEEDEEDELLDLDEDQDATDEISNIVAFTQQLQEGLYDGFSEDVDAENYSSPLDDVDPYVFYAQRLEVFAAREGAFYQQWSSNPQLASTLQAVVAEAHKRKAEAAKN